MEKVYFNEGEHRYFTESGKELISVSKFTDNFKEKIDWNSIAKKVAASETRKGNICTQKDILDKWNRKRKISSEIGTLYHSIRENELLGREFIEIYNTKCETYSCPFDKGYKYSIPIQDLKNNSVYLELMIYDLEHGICGQSDKVIVANNRINIWDYKGLSLDTEIPTKNGFKLMRDIVEGDIIYDGNGNHTIVKHVSEIHYNPCYKITFDTNDTIIADHEHKWIISKRLGKGKYKEIEKRTYELENMFNLKVPIRIECTKLNQEDKNLPIDPYVLGAWLGDGSSHSGRITNMNQSLWIEIKNRGFNIGEDISKGSSGKAEDRTIFGLEKLLRENGLLKNKHIPEIYLRSSYNQRLDLLRGIMDTDGYFHQKRKICVMNTTKEWQANLIVELVSSLGWKATKMYTKGSGFGKRNISTIQVSFNPTESPFLTKNIKFVRKNSEKSKFRFVKRIEIIETVPTKCISVTSESHTYLSTRSYIKTHNTDEELKSKAFSSQWVDPKKLTGPLSHLDECNLNIYSIKMSLYMYMLWRANKGRFLPGELIIEHVHLKRDPDDDNIPVLDEVGNPIVLKIEQVKLPYRKKEVMDMLKTLKK